MSKLINIIKYDATTESVAILGGEVGPLLSSIRTSYYKISYGYFYTRYENDAMGSKTSTDCPMACILKAQDKKKRKKKEQGSIQMNMKTIVDYIVL